MKQPAHDLVEKCDGENRYRYPGPSDLQIKWKPPRPPDRERRQRRRQLVDKRISRLYNFSNESKQRL